MSNRSDEEVSEGPATVEHSSNPIDSLATAMICRMTYFPAGGVSSVLDSGGTRAAVSFVRKALVLNIRSVSNSWGSLFIFTLLGEYIPIRSPVRFRLSYAKASLPLPRVLRLHHAAAKPKPMPKPKHMHMPKLTDSSVCVLLSLQKCLTAAHERRPPPPPSFLLRRRGES